MRGLISSEACETVLNEQSLRSFLNEAVGCMTSPHLKLMNCGLKEQFLRPLLKEAVGCMPSPHLKLMSCGLKDGLEMS